MSLVCTTQISAYNFSDETLHYVISYKWGLIHKDAGEATLSLKAGKLDYNATLTAKTKPWADKFFTVRDTLKSTITINGFKPKRYIKIAHEGGKYGRDEITYSYAGNYISGNCVRHRLKNGKSSNSTKTLTSSRLAYDMLSIFYYLRTLDFDKLGSGKVVKATIFSGSKAETISIRCIGIEVLKLRDKSKRKAYHIRFNFTTEGGKQSSDDMDTWISADKSRIPLQLEGNLPVGKVKCYYISK